MAQVQNLYLAYHDLESIPGRIEILNLNHRDQTRNLMLSSHRLWLFRQWTDYTFHRYLMKCAYSQLERFRTRWTLAIFNFIYAAPINRALWLRSFS